jgi:hypothetical protein
LTVIDRQQGNSTKARNFELFMEALRQGWIRHSGDPEFRRHALNALAKTLDGGAAKFVRPSETRQGGNQDVRVIDALDAASMVHAVMAEGVGSVYDDRGLIVIG